MPLYRTHANEDLNNADSILVNPYAKLERRPRNTSLQLHDQFVQWFTQKHKISFRSKGLFCTGDIEVARSYVDTQHSLISITPVGDYSLCFSPECKDLFQHFRDNCHMEDSDQKQIFEELDRLNFLVSKNSGIPEAIESMNEIMIIAERYKYKYV